MTTPFTGAGVPVLQASTGAAGFALQNGTPTVLTWTAPNDGLMHRIRVTAWLNVTSLQTGGAVVLNKTNPDGSTPVTTMFAGGLAVSGNPFDAGRLVAPGSTVTVAQSSAQTAGAAVLYAEIWGS